VEIEHWRKEASAFNRKSKVNDYFDSVLSLCSYARTHLQIISRNAKARGVRPAAYRANYNLVDPSVRADSLPPKLFSLTSSLGLRPQLRIASAPSPTCSSNSWDSSRHPDESTDCRRCRLCYQSLQFDPSSPRRSTKSPPLLAAVHPTNWIGYSTRYRKIPSQVIVLSASSSMDMF
jgi:hypothetical protein